MAGRELSMSAIRLLQNYWTCNTCQVPGQKCDDGGLPGKRGSARAFPS